MSRESVLLSPHAFQLLVDAGEICAWCGRPEQSLGRYCQPSCLIEHRAALDRARDARRDLLEHYGSEDAIWEAAMEAFR